MNPHKTKVFKLRAGVTLAAILGVLLCMTPAFVVYAADAGPVVTAPAKKAEPASAPVATTEPAAKAETKNDTKENVPTAATSEKEQSWWQALLVPVLGVLGMFIAAFLAAGLRKLVLLIEKKWSIDIPDSVEKLMYDKARWALGWAEEKAEKRLLYGDGKKTPGAEKLSQVVEMLEKFADGLGYGHEWQRDKIEALAEGVLHLERNTASTSNVARDVKLTEKKNGNGNA
jgi:hypothetical protein